MDLELVASRLCQARGSDMICLNRCQKAVLYVPETGEFFWKKRSDVGANWNSRYAGRQAFTSVDQRGYFQGSIGNQFVAPHRLAWALSYGRWPRDIVDHINGVKTDNRLANLRLATQRQNQQNAGSHGGSSKYCGVSFHRRDKRWQAYCYDAEGRHCHLGYFTSEIDAAHAYDAAASRLHGAFSRLNFPINPEVRT